MDIKKIIQEELEGWEWVDDVPTFGQSSIIFLPPITMVGDYMKIARLLEDDGYTWSDEAKPTEWNPIEGNARYVSETNPHVNHITKIDLDFDRKKISYGYLTPEDNIDKPNYFDGIDGWELINR